MLGGIASDKKFSILYMPTLLPTQLGVGRREHRAYDDVSRNNHFREAPMATRKKAAKKAAKRTKRPAKKAAKKGAKKAAKKAPKRRKKAAKKAAKKA